METEPEMYYITVQTLHLQVLYGGEIPSQRIVGKQQELKESVLHQAEEWHVVPAPRMPAKHGFQIKHTYTHTHTIAAGGSKMLTCPPAKMTGDPEGLGR